MKYGDQCGRCLNIGFTPKGTVCTVSGKRVSKRDYGCECFEATEIRNDCNGIGKRNRCIKLNNSTPLCTEEACPFYEKRKSERNK